MDRQPTTVPETLDTRDAHMGSHLESRRSAWQNIKARILAGLLLVLPILITLWVIFWLYSTLEGYVIDPLARMVLWKVRQGQPNTELPFWFETYAAPLIAILIALLLLYCLGFFARSRLRRAVDWVLLRVPLMSVVYDAARQVFQTLEGRQHGHQNLQRVVLITFPHPGMKAPAFVTATCRDTDTQAELLCVFVPTAPMPWSGFFLLVPKEEVTELDWNAEQALQAIISIGLTAPQQVRYSSTGSAAEIRSASARITGGISPDKADEVHPPQA